MKACALFICFILFWPACRQKENTPIQAKRSSFSYFELSHVSGWSRGFSFSVDSNRIFFIPGFLQAMDGNYVKYGLLPDSIYQSIDSIVKGIKGIRSMNPDSLYCYDCDEIALKVIINNDTVNIYQAKEIDETIWQLIEKMQALKKNDTLYQFKALYFYLETADVLQDPPEVITK